MVSVLTSEDMVMVMVPSRVPILHHVEFLKLPWFEMPASNRPLFKQGNTYLLRDGESTDSTPYFGLYGGRNQAMSKPDHECL